MAKKQRPAPLFQFLDGLETRDDAVKKRLQRILRRIPECLSVVTRSLTAPTIGVEVALMNGLGDRALELANMAIGVAPEDPDCWVAMAKALGSLNAVPQARGALQRAAQLGGAGPEFDYWAAALNRDDRAALDHIMDACESDSSFPEALFLAARLAAKLGWQKEGAAMLDKIGPLMAGSSQCDAYQRFLDRSVGRRRPAPTAC